MKASSKFNADESVSVSEILNVKAFVGGGVGKALYSACFAHASQQTGMSGVYVGNAAKADIIPGTEPPITYKEVNAKAMWSAAKANGYKKVKHAHDKASMTEDCLTGDAIDVSQFA